MHYWCSGQECLATVSFKVNGTDQDRQELYFTDCTVNFGKNKREVGNIFWLICVFTGESKKMLKVLGASTKLAQLKTHRPTVQSAQTPKYTILL